MLENLQLSLRTSLTSLVGSIDSSLLEPRPNDSVKCTNIVDSLEHECEVRDRPLPVLASPPSLRCSLFFVCLAEPFVRSPGSPGPRSTLYRSASSLGFSSAAAVHPMWKACAYQVLFLGFILLTLWCRIRRRVLRRFCSARRRRWTAANTAAAVSSPLYV